jgi:pentatricopeptide repeat protein
VRDVHNLTEVDVSKLLTVCKTASSVDALALYRSLLAAGFTPNPMHCSALISVLATSGHWDAAVEAFEEMKVR